MIHEKIFLKDIFNGIKTEATITAYVHDVSNEIEPDRRRASVLICPGGGYRFVSEREGEPVALAFVSKGYNAFVLDYSTADRCAEHYPTQLIEASAAIAYMRRNADRYHLITDAISVCGFSAGGHLAASVGTLWNEKVVEETLGIEYGENKPNGLILCYPVITGGEFAHRGSFVNLLGENPSAELMHKCSLENSVGAHTPPTFIWQTFTDAAVPVENAFLFAKSLRKENIPFELHIYPDGHHGLALGTRETATQRPDGTDQHMATWMDLCARWIARFIDK